jgi:hypothetical protein
VASTAPRSEESHSDLAVASGDENCVNVPAEVVISLADSVIKANQAIIAERDAEIALLKRRLRWATAIWKPIGVVIQ